MSWAERIETPRGISAGRKPTVAVIGGGVSGLTAAYDLAKAGFNVSVFEASNRLGGRVFTDYDAFREQEQHCEKGGEWIDSTHHDIRGLAHELKLDVQDITKKRTGEELFYFNGRFYAPRDFLHYDREKGETTGAYVKLARHIGRDRRRMHNNPQYARELDAIDMDTYLARAQQATQTESWVIESIKAAYKGEFGEETDKLSAFQLVEQIGTGLRRPFEVYGPRQDESQRIRGGNRKLIEALERKVLELGGKIHPGHALAKVDYRADLGKHPVYLEFEHEHRKKTRNFDYAVCTLPFTRLRQVKGMDELAQRGLLSAEKRNAIREMGYGNIVKIMLGMNGRPWENNPRFPVPANGSFRSDNPYLQNTWITSVGQHGEDSILTILVAGNEAKQPIGAIMRGCKKAAADVFGMSEEALFNHHHALHIWPKNPFVFGSYSYMKPGHCTTVRLEAEKPALEGRLGFAGEHVDPDLYGYMNGAVRSARKEARRIIELERAHGQGAGRNTAV